MYPVLGGVVVEGQQLLDVLSDLGDGLEDFAQWAESKASAWPQRDQDAVLQPPRPDMRPAPQIERVAEIEAAV